MNELANVFQEMSEKLSVIGNKLDEISSKLDNVNSVYGIDDIVEKLNEVSSNITGPIGYHLGDIHDIINSQS